jgi:hypothetical protein
MNNVTEALKASVEFEKHLAAHDKAVAYLICIGKARIRAAIKLHDANNPNFSLQYAAKCLKQWASAKAAEKKLTKSYKRQLFNLFYKSKL